MDIKSMLDEIKARKRLTKNKIVVGNLDEKVVEFLDKKGVPIHTKEIYLTHKGLSHLARGSKRKRGAGLSEEDILKIPEILKNPSAIYFDKGKNRFNLLYCKPKDKECIKIAIDTKGYASRGNKMTIIKTAGYIQKSDMNDIIFELLYGEL
jgi:hypothetical protein